MPTDRTRVNIFDAMPRSENVLPAIPAVCAKSGRTSPEDFTIWVRSSSLPYLLAPPKWSVTNIVSQRTRSSSHFECFIWALLDLYFYADSVHNSSNLCQRRRVNALRNGNSDRIVRGVNGGTQGAACKESAQGVIQAPLGGCQLGMTEVHRFGSIVARERGSGELLGNRSPAFLSYERRLRRTRSDGHDELPNLIVEPHPCVRPLKVFLQLANDVDLRPPTLGHNIGFGLCG